MNTSNSSVRLQIKNLGVCRQSGNDPFKIELPNLSLSSGEIIAITGQSGSGKSTLLEVIGLILTPEVLESYLLKIDSQSNQLTDITQEVLSRNETRTVDIRAQAMGFILQHGGLLPFLTVKDNIELTRIQKGLPAQADFIEELISVLGLKRLVKKMPHQLSIGERQRVAFIRAVAHEPAILLADEPTASLDPYNAERLFEILHSLVPKLNLCVLLVSHDWSLLKKYQIQCLHAVNHSQHRSLFEYI